MNSGYSAADIYAMQKEAEQRVFEMQRRARKTLELDNSEENLKKEEQPIQKNRNNPVESVFSDSYNEIFEDNIAALQNTEYNSNEKEQKEEKISDGIAGFLLQDKERALIVLLLLILIRENADESVILVLLYLMMEPS